MNTLTEKENKQIEEAADILRAGGIVAFPTETVYGLGAVATHSKAIRRVYEAKQRPYNHPVIVHVSQIDQVTEWASHIDERGRALIAYFWPGPLTLILRRARGVLDAITGGQDTVAIRMPAHPIALSLIERVGEALIAPSANQFGHLSPTHPDHVCQGLGGRVDFVIDGGYCQIGIESTILDLSSKDARVLRLGAIMPSQIEQVLGMPLSNTQRLQPRVPGDLLQHYSPRTLFLTVDPDKLMGKIKQYQLEGKKMVVLSRKINSIQTQGVVWLQMPLQPADYMQMLYHFLFLADQQGADVILAEQLPGGEAWISLQDRMTRAVHTK